MDPLNNVAILGATGSVGEHALHVLARYPERYCVFAMTAGNDYRKLARLASVWRPAVIGIARVAHYRPLLQELRDLGVSGVDVVSGPEEVAAIAGLPQVDTAINCVVGAAGLQASVAAAEAGKKLLIANKESVVCGGRWLLSLAREKGATVLPVDSEHNAIAQCLLGEREADRRAATVWLTCSGGPFHAQPELDLAEATADMALAHPTWRMGAKISVDSATLMNKGLEVIEASYLFDLPPERIKVVVHPQSVVHSMVEFSDGAIIAQLGPTDMSLPISWCLGYPDRLDPGVDRLDPLTISGLTFEPPDLDRFPLLRLAYTALAAGGTAPIVLNAANEVAVEAFLAGRIRFTDIAELCARALDRTRASAPRGLEDILAVDARARARAARWLRSGGRGGR